jgi:hypothetical protein
VVPDATRAARTTDGSLVLVAEVNPLRLPK